MTEWQAQQAEHAILGAIIIEAAGQDRSGILHEVAKIIQPEYFMDAKFKDNQHARIYAAMLGIAGPLNEITITLQLSKQAVLQSHDHAEIPLCVSQCPCSLDWQSYAEVVREYHLRRNGKVISRGIELP